MNNFLKLSLSLCLSSAAASAASTPLANTDFRFDSEGQVVNIDKNGAELYLYYQGDTREAGDNISIAIDDPNLKVTNSKVCNVKTSPDTCKFVLKYANIKLPSYGIKTITVSEQSGKRVALYTIWVKPSNDEKEIRWRNSPFRDTVKGPVILQNGTHSVRTYGMHVSGNERSFTPEQRYVLKLNLPGKSLCYVDGKLFDPSLTSDGFVFTMSYSVWDFELFKSIFHDGDYLIDETDPSDTSYNGPYKTANNNIGSCATEGLKQCSRKSESWTLGLMNLSGETLKNGSEKINSGEIKYLKNRSWNGGNPIYWTGKWSEKRLALLSIQGTTDGSGFDPSKTSPSLQQVQTAPPCSKYTNQPAPRQQILNVRIEGPGSILDERGVVYDTGFQTYKVDDGMLLELTAVPEEGRKFKGWIGENCSDDSLHCAFNVDGYTDITALFE